MDLTARTAEQPNSRTDREALRRTRKARGWTQSDISARTNLRVATISSLENGDASTKLATVLAIVAALGLEFRLVGRGGSLVKWSGKTGQLAKMYPNPLQSAPVFPSF